MPRFHTINGEDVQFTEEEEISRNEEERVEKLEVVVRVEKAQKKAALKAKLADDSITFEEMKELMRLRG